MATGDLVTLAQGLAVLSQTSDPGGIIAGLISSVSTQIQNFIGYQLASATYTRTLNGIGGQKMLLPDRPVTAVNSLTIDTVTVPLAVPPTAGFLFDTKFVYLYGYDNSFGGYGSVSAFNRGVQNIVINYTAGFVAIPADIQQACLNWLGSAFALIGQDVTVKALRAGDTQIDFGHVTTVLGKVTLLVPPAIVSALLPYRRVAT